MPLAAIGLIAGIGGSVAQGVIGAHAAKSAADAQAQAAEQAAQLQHQDAQAALDFQKSVYGDQQRNIAPWLQVGQGAITTLAGLLGLTPPQAAAVAQANPQAANAILQAGGGVDQQGANNPLNPNVARLSDGSVNPSGSSFTPDASLMPNGANQPIPLSSLTNPQIPNPSAVTPGAQNPPNLTPSSLSPSPATVGNPASAVNPASIQANGSPASTSVPLSSLAAPQSNSVALLGPPATDNGGQQAVAPPDTATQPNPVPSNTVSLSSMNPIFQTGDTGSLLEGWTNQFQAPTNVTEQNDPGFQFRLQQGQQALERSAAARGGLLSGGTAKAEQRYGQDYASNEYQNVYNRGLTQYQQAYNIFQQNQANRFNRLAAIAGVGQTAAGQLNSAGFNAANNVSNTLLTSGQQIGQDLNNIGAARGSGYVGAGNAYGGIAGGIGNAISLYQILRGSKPPQPTDGNI